MVLPAAEMGVFGSARSAGDPADRVGLRIPDVEQDAPG
jgi:hypothetical protein